MFDVPHRHIVFSIPRDLWYFVYDKSQWKMYMECARTCFVNYIPVMLKTLKRKYSSLEYGIICVFHPFGKDMKFHPHLHLLVTEGGFDKSGNFHHIKYFPAKGFRKTWQYVVMNQFQKCGLSNTFATEIFKKYPNGFYVWVHKQGRIKNRSLVSRYVGRYVRHPAISNRRITRFDGHHVYFYYEVEGEIVEVIMTSDEFISSLIQHIPEPNFKMVRYFCAYSRRRKGKLGSKLQSGIKQTTLYKFGLIKPILCPFCHYEMEYVLYCRKPPDGATEMDLGLLKWIR
jgi:hypothetical protein